MAAEALNAAVQNGSIEEVKQLLDEGVEINSKVVTGGWTALHCAVQNKKEEIVHLLLDRGADPHVRKNNGATPFIVAGIVGSVELLELFLSKGSDINEHDINGFTAFMEASCYGKEDALRFLYSCGADVNLRRAVDEEKRALKKGGATALMDAARNGHIVIVKTLVEEMNADMHICDNQERNALVHALSVTEDKNWDRDKEAIALFLLKHGIAVNKRDEYGKTALILASERQSQDLVKAILEKDEVDVNATDSNHKTALCVAVENKNHAIARILCEHGARTDIKNQNLIASARKLYDYKMVELLQHFGAVAVSRQPQKQWTLPSKRWQSKLQQLQQNCADIGKLQICKINYFRIQGTSQGGVYLGFFDGEAVAVKIFRTGTENAEREKTCLEKCRASNHLVKFYGWEEKKACLYLCLTLCEQNLEEYLRVKENATMKSKDILEGVFQAVQELHGFGFGHQDLHPRNILIDVTGKVFLADFDKCRKLIDDETDLIISEDVKALERLVIYVAMEGKSCFEDLPTECPEDVTDYEEIEDLRASLSSFDESIPVSEQLGCLMHHPYFWSKQM
ncbi:2-5A-dependent ribonuclease isoform X2 [Tiliqua scincoides]